MNEKERKQVIDELKQRLNADEVVFVQTDPPTIQEGKNCEKCGASVNTKVIESGFIRCPNCGYPIWFNRYLRVSDLLGRLSWYCIKDDNDNTVKDYKGDLRLFESEDAARKYLACCELNPERFTIMYYGKV